MACGKPTAAPRESHPPSIPLGPTHCLRRSERSDCGYRGVPDLLCVVAHALPGAFCGAGRIAHFTEGHSAPAVRLGTEGMYLSAFMLRRSCLPGFLCQKPAAEGGKGNTPCFWLLHRQYLEGSYNTDTQLRFQLVPHGFVYLLRFCLPSLRAASASLCLV